jgi:hypothetical protein
MAINFLNNVSLNKNQLEQARIENLATDPASGVLGQIIFNTTSNVLKVCTVESPTAAVFSEVGGGVLAITSGNVNTISIGGTASNPTISAVTSAVANGSLNLVTGDAVYDFVTGLGYVESVDVNGSTFITVTDGGTTADPTFAVSLAATGTPTASTYLRGDNTWAALPSLYTGWTLAGNSGTSQVISNGNTASILGTGVIATVASATDTLTISHSNVTRTDTSSAASPAFGGTFTVVDGVTSSSQGHITALNLKTVTLPANTPQTITLSGDVTGTGTTAITTTISAGAVDFAMINPAAVITSGEGLATNDNDTSWPTSAAVIDYVSAAVVGGLVYKGAYNAATNTPNLDSTPIAGIKTGWTYTVTADGLFFTEQVRVGDVLIAEIDSPTTLADWTTVQNNIDVATLSTVGIGNVNAGTGVGVAYSNGTATVTNTDLGSSQNIFKNVAVSGQSTVVADSNNDTLTLAAGSNISITTNAATDTVTIANTYVAPTTSYATTIAATATVTHNLGTLDVIVQLYDTVTNDTVYADVTRASTNTVTVTFSAAPLNAVRVLVQK